IEHVEEVLEEARAFDEDHDGGGAEQEPSVRAATARDYCHEYIGGDGGGELAPIDISQGISVKRAPDPDDSTAQRERLDAEHHAVRAERGRDDVVLAHGADGATERRVQQNLQGDEQAEHDGD